MKILISSDGIHAHYYERMAWAKAFTQCGHDVVLWDCKSISAFDVFDKFEPDIFLGQSYNLDRALLKCIKERPHLRIGLRAGDWGDHESTVDKTKYNILYCTDKEKEILKKLKDETGQPEFIYIHYPERAIDITHNHFKSIGIKAASIMMSADIITYANAKYIPYLDCDIGFVGGYWPHKGIIIDQYLTPLLFPIGKYKVKIFGNQRWNVNQYCGLISDSNTANLFASAKICPNLSEPHAHAYGFDVNERIFKILYAGGFCIADNVESYKIFNDGVVIAESPEDFKSKIDYYLQNREERVKISNIGKNIIKKNHTSHHRAAQIMDLFGYKFESKKILERVNNA